MIKVKNVLIPFLFFNFFCFRINEKNMFCSNFILCGALREEKKDVCESCETFGVLDIRESICTECERDGICLSHPKKCVHLICLFCFRNKYIGSSLFYYTPYNNGVDLKSWEDILEILHEFREKYHAKCYECKEK